MEPIHEPAPIDWRTVVAIPDSIAALVLSVPCAAPPADTCPNGNGYFRVLGTNEYAHRRAYRESGGQLLGEDEVDHLCHSIDPSCSGGDSCPHRACSEPRHLQAVTPLVNLMRSTAPTAKNARKSTCPSGHPLVPKPATRAGRYCPICRYRQRVAYGEISAKGRKVDRTHCPRGHEYTLENTYIARKPDGSFRSRHCKRCAAIRTAERRARGAA
jgi:hypothetical protein